MSIHYSDNSASVMRDEQLFHIMNIPKPSQVIIFSPHPDDISIAMGSFVILSVLSGIPIKSILMTNGSEAVIPDVFLNKFGWHTQMSVSELCRLRGDIRFKEAQEEAIRLGLPRESVILLKKQGWHKFHRTPIEAMNADGSIKDVDKFKPGPIDSESLDELCQLFRKFAGKRVLCAIPSPYDRQMMHRFTTVLVLKALSTLPLHHLKTYSLLIYKCLSTENWEIDVTHHRVLGFNEKTMTRKCHAIMANKSMKSRREIMGGYSNSGKEFYDTIIRKENAENARHFKSRNSFAECYQWASIPDSKLWNNMSQWAKARYIEFLK